MKRGAFMVAVAIAAAGGGIEARLTAGAAPAQQEIPGISAEALAQIEALISEKDGRSGAALKMDSQLIYELKMANGQPVAAGVQTVATDLEYTTDDRLVLDVKASVSDALLTQLRSMGYTIINAADGNIRLLSDIFSVEALAALPDVAFVHPKQDATTSRIGATPSVVQRHRGRDLIRQSALRASIQSAVAGAAETAAGTGVGSRSSEGDMTHLAFAARGAFGVTGAGVKIGVLSDGVSNLAVSQALGDLGPVTVLPGQAGSGDEGTAMLEIVHDLAPGADLYFATAFSGITSFASNIRALRAAGCDIIVDDVFYYVETPFQDGQAPGVISTTNGGAVIQAVNDVTADGALFFSSAGNSGNLNDGTAGTWEGDFVDGGATAAPLGAGRVHLFNGAQAFNMLTFANTAAPISLYWSDPLGGSTNDYDLFRLNPAGTAVAAASVNIQNGTQDPIEQISQSTPNPRIVIVKKNAAAARFLHLNANRGRFTLATPGTTHGHSSAAGAFSVAATPAGAAFPNAFTSSNVVESFSSDGPRRVFFQANGTPITAGNFSSTGGLLRQKPDITAADGTSVTGVGGFPSPFFGTSAAAPHAAAIAALLKSKDPALTPAQIRTALTSTAIDIEAPGVDRDSGAGIVMPIAALQSVGAIGTAFFAVTTAVATENPGNGNGVVNGGEGARLAIGLKNFGVQNATGVSATIGTSATGVTVTVPNSSAYPDMAASGGVGSNVSPYLFTLAPNVPCPLPVTFTLNVSYNAGVQSIPVEVVTGPSAISVATTMDAVAPPSGPGFTGATGTQATRVFRDGIASNCAAPKATFPGVTSPGNRQYDVFNFSLCAEATPSCATVTVAGAAAINLFSAAYIPSFDPTNLATNYVADAGVSSASRSYSFLAPATGTVAVNVHDVPISPTSPTNTNYTLTMSGLCAGACATPNQLPIAKVKDVTVSAGEDCTAPASIDDGSFDPDGDPVTITQSPAGPYPIGTTAVLLTITDKFGATRQALAAVTVVDTTAPAVSGISPSRTELWPANHNMIPIVVNYSIADSCTPGGACTLSVSSNEPLDGSGDGNTSPDWQIIDNHHVLLRAERSGDGSGRIYTITITCTDGVGNRSVKTTTVSVPHNQ